MKNNFQLSQNMEIGDYFPTGGYGETIGRLREHASDGVPPHYRFSLYYKKIMYLDLYINQMSNLSLFASRGLKTLYKKGALNQVLDKFKEQLSKKTLLATGNDASAFVYNDGKQVLKLCLKDIRYFKNY